MNTLILRKTFEREVDLKEQGRCPFCARHVPHNSLRDDLSRKEFKITGLCQPCQDEIFGV